MAVNRDKVDIWKTDVAKSVDFYNNWFLNFAPKAFRDTRIIATKEVVEALKTTENLTSIQQDVLAKNPSVLPMLRMATCPPIARDRLIGLAGVSPNLVKSMELKKVVPPRMAKSELNIELQKIADIRKLAGEVQKGNFNKKNVDDRRTSIIDYCITRFELN